MEKPKGTNYLVSIIIKKEKSLLLFVAKGFFYLWFSLKELLFCENATEKFMTVGKIRNYISIITCG